MSIADGLEVSVDSRSEDVDSGSDNAELGACANNLSLVRSCAASRKIDYALLTLYAQVMMAGNSLAMSFKTRWRAIFPFTPKELLLAAFLLSVISAIPSAQAFPYSKYGLVDKTGKEIVPCRYRRAEYLGHDIFLFEEPPSLAAESPGWLLCDRNGRKVDIKIPNDGNLVKLFFPKKGKGDDTKPDTRSNERALVQFHCKTGNGLCTLNGVPVVDPKYSYIEPYDDDQLLLFTGESETLSASVFDLNLLKVKTDISDIRLFPFDDFRSGNRLCGYKRLSGEVAIKPVYKDAFKFSSRGFAIVTLGENQHVYIDQDNRRVSQVFSGIRDCENGFAIVTVRTSEGKLRKGVINSQLKFVLEPTFEDVIHVYGNHFSVQERNNKYKTIVVPANTASKVLETLRAPVAGSSNVLVVSHASKSPSGNSVYSILREDGAPVVELEAESVWSAFGLVLLSQKVPGRRDRKFVIVDEGGIVNDGIIATRLEVVSPDRLLKAEDDTNWSAADWQRFPPMRPLLLGVLLRNYDLIGMRREEIHALLGKPDNSSLNETYSMTWNAMCGNSIRNLQLEYQNDRLNRWRISRHGQEGGWITTNVVLSDDSAGSSPWSRMVFEEKVAKRD